MVAFLRFSGLLPLSVTSSAAGFLVAFPLPASAFPALLPASSAVPLPLSCLAPVTGTAGFAGAPALPLVTDQRRSDVTDVSSDGCLLGS